MRGFALHLHGATAWETVEQVHSFVGRDASGSFGILPGHEAFITALEFGLARYRCVDAVWQYLALPGGILHVTGGEVFVFTRRYLRDTDYRRISTQLEDQLRAEHVALSRTRASLQQMQQHLLRRLWELEQRGHGNEQ